MIKTSGFRVIRRSEPLLRVDSWAWDPRSVFSSNWWGNNRRSQMRYSREYTNYRLFPAQRLNDLQFNEQFRRGQLGWRSWMGKAPLR